MHIHSRWGNVAGACSLSLPFWARAAKSFHCCVEHEIGGSLDWAWKESVVSALQVWIWYVYIYIFTIMCIYIHSYVSVISVYHILSVYLSICISEYQFEESEAQWILIRHLTCSLPGAMTLCSSPAIGTRASNNKSNTSFAEVPKLCIRTGEQGL